MAQKVVFDKSSQIIKLAEAQVMVLGYLGKGKKAEARINFLNALVTTIKRGVDGEALVKECISNLSGTSLQISRAIKSDLKEIMISSR